MIKLKFGNPAQYRFAATLAERLSRVEKQIQADDSTHTLTFNNNDWSDLFVRLEAAESAALPWRMQSDRQDFDWWIIVGKNVRALDQAFLRIASLIQPSYGEFVKRNGVMLQSFEAGKSPIHSLGAQLYPTGCYLLKTPVIKRKIVHRNLTFWLTLEEREPSFEVALQPTYQSLLQKFQVAVAALKWHEARTTINEMRRNYLASAENISFFELQLAAAQDDWLAIWQRDDYTDLARLRVPSHIRGALLTAFHFAELMPLEQQQDWHAIAEKINQYRDRLGLLLKTQAGLQDAPVLRVFAYLAVAERDLAKLERLANDTPAFESETHKIITSLKELITVPLSPDLSDLQRAQNAFQNGNIDLALEILTSLTHGPEQTLLHLEIAFDLNDALVAFEALDSYESLDQGQQQELLKHHRHIPFYIDKLTALVDTIGTKDSEHKNLADWLEQAILDPFNTQLKETLDDVLYRAEERNKDLSRLNDLLLDFATTRETLEQPYAEKLFTALTTAFVNAEIFPAEDATNIQLYELLVNGLSETSRANENLSKILLRLTESILHVAPERRNGLCEYLASWFDTPIPVLETYVLDAFEILAEYGIEPWRMAELYELWVRYLLNLPTVRDSLNLAAWGDLGRWIGVDTALLERLVTLQATIEEKIEREDPIKFLPDGYLIGIFTLRHSSAERAAAELRKRNSGLDIRLSLEKSMNPQVESLARNAQMAVVVTTCIKHAITYGIKPLLSAPPVYPQSSGSASILRAIEEAAAERV